ncbi:hypothetical protein ABTE16_20335, partial [Acinetobacter baumannii]
MPEQQTTQIQPPHAVRLNAAIDAHMAGRREEARAVYEAVLEDDPIEPVALHFYGIWLHQAG